MSVSDIPEAVWAALGATGGYVARLFSSDSKTAKEMQFIKGKLEQLVSLLQSSEETRVRQAVMEESLKAVKKDLDAAHRAIREAKTSLPPLPRGNP